MITFDRTDFFGSQATAISGSNGAYVVSTAKEGILSGLSTMIFESAAPPVGDRKLLAKFIYASSLSKSDRKKLHNELVEILDTAIDSREMHEMVISRIKEDDFYPGAENILERMDADIGRDLILSKINGWVLRLLSKKLLASYTLNYPPPF